MKLTIIEGSTEEITKFHAQNFIQGESKATHIDPELLKKAENIRAPYSRDFGAAETSRHEAPTDHPPLPGQPWPEQGGIYAGIMPALEGQAAYHLIIDNQDLPREHAWGNTGRHAGASSLHDGLANTRALLEAGSPAAMAVNDINESGASTQADWYLPAKREMQLITATCSEHMTADQLYWTSTQSSANYAWFQSFKHGGTYIYYKDYTLRVRPVRRLNLKPSNS